PESEAYLCPVRALRDWISVFRPGKASDYLYPPMRAGDRIGEADRHISADAFLEFFRNNLLDIGIDPLPYGTHSFRRGGCQWLSSGCRWPLRQICDWGGWSLNFTSMTIVKYLISWNDDPTERREDYMNPNRKPTVQCHACGRRCHCG
ncbi:uncharacterized protein TRAVEDRAFT_123077, partial [Trametes versicolor FP-101664 SS1]|uniref:uncharacterized protein n=1 Tax=Trametes versicolor (strain FP-101664) TaxID=717944 RepID=UPI0004623007